MRKEICISLLDTGCVFWSKTEPVIANAEFGNTLANTGEIKHCQRRQKSVLELQNRCSTTELNWLNALRRAACICGSLNSTFDEPRSAAKYLSSPTDQMESCACPAGEFHVWPRGSTLLWTILRFRTTIGPLMHTKASPIPAGFHTVTPFLVVNDAARAIEFYKNAFDAREIMRFAGPDGKIGHAQIQVGNSMLMLCDECPQRNAAGPCPTGDAGRNLSLCGGLRHDVRQGGGAGSQSIVRSRTNSTVTVPAR